MHAVGRSGPKWKSSKYMYGRISILTNLRQLIICWFKLSIGVCFSIHYHLTVAIINNNNHHHNVAMYWSCSSASTYCKLLILVFYLYRVVHNNTTIIKVKKNYIYIYWNAQLYTVWVSLSVESYWVECRIMEIIRERIVPLWRLPLQSWVFFLSADLFWLFANCCQVSFVGRESAKK